MPAKFLILDGHSLAYRAFHALPVENFATSGGQHTNAVYGFMSMLATALKDQQPTHIAVAFDLSRETFRTQQFSAYKATRAKSPEEFKGQVELIKQLLAALGITVVTAENYEADDILATLAAQTDVPVTIITGDRDAFQLASQRVRVLYPRKGMSDLADMNDEAIQAKYGIPAQRYRDMAAMVGESSDNLPGVPGVGEKTAAKWINQYGGLPQILESIDELGGKVGENFRAHVDQVRLNYELNRLVDTVPIETTLETYAKRSYDAQEAHRLFDELEFGQLRTRVAQVWAPGEGADQSPDVATTAGKRKVAASAPVVDAVALTARTAAEWLAAHDSKPVAVAFYGSWARGEGEMTAVAFAADSGECAWGMWSDIATPAGAWLSGAQPKVIHDAKGPSLALRSSGVELAGVQFDTAIAAYLVSPGTRSFDLADLVERYLHSELASEKQAEQATLQFDIDGQALAARARATLDLADVLRRDLGQRGGSSLLTDVELPLAAVLSRMESVGIAVNRAALKKLETSFEDDANAAVKQAHQAAGHEFNLGSPKQLQEVLFEERGLPKTKKNKTGYTTDAESLQGLLAKVPDDELLLAVLRFREVSKLRQTVTGLLGCVSHDDRIHTTFNQMVAATGRLSSTDPNLQNIPIRTSEGIRIRDAFVVGHGFDVLLTADYSQIEMRVMAHLSQDDALIAALTSGEDLHTTVGSQVFGVPASDVTADMRRQIKAMSYGLAYGLSAFGLAQQLGISNEAARALMTNYFERFGEVRDYLTTVVAQARKDGYTESILGRRRYLPDLTSDNRQLREMAERMALNAPIQGSAADIVKVAMLAIDKELSQNKLKSRLLLQVHDEVIVEVAPGEQSEVEDLVRRCMAGAADLAVPLDVSIGVGKTWSQAAH